MREGAREQKEGGAKAGPANLIDTARDFMLGLHGGMHTVMTWDEVNSEWLRSATGGTLVFLERDGLSRKFVDGECPEQPGDREEQDTLGHIDAWADTSTSTETPVVALHCVCLMSRLRRAEIIAEVAVGVEGIRIFVALLVMMQGKAVQDQCGALGNEHAVIHEVFG